MVSRDNHLAWWLFFILLAGFTIFYSGVPGTDDEQLFASAAQSYAVMKHFSADQVYGNERLKGFYSNIAPLHTWLGSIIYRFAEILQTGGLQCFFLLSPFYSALTGFFLVKIAQLRGYSRNVICMAILLFGFATMVFAYSKSFFREPLAMLLVTASFYEIEFAFNKKSENLPAVFRIFFSLILLILAIWTKEFLIVCLPLFFLYYIRLQNKRKSEFSAVKRKDILKTNISILILSLVLIIFLGFFFFKDNIGRFSISYLSRLWMYLANLKHEHFFSSLWGVFFSLSKGFLVYSPILLLVAFSPLFLKKVVSKEDYFMAWGAAIEVAILQVFFYDDAWWTFTWSTRFLLPVIPFWIIALLPVIEWVIKQNNKWVTTLCLFLIVLSFLLQLGSVLISSADFAQFIMNQYHLRLSEINITNIAAVPAIGHWIAFFKGVITDVSWIRTIQAGSFGGLGLPAILFLVIILITFIYSKFSESSDQFQRITILTILGFTFLLPILILFGCKGDPYYAGDQVSFQDLISALAVNVGEKDLVLIDAYNQPLWYFYFNFGFPKTNWIGLPPAHLSLNSNMALYPFMNETMNFILERNKPLSLIWLASEKKEQDTLKDYSVALLQSGFLKIQDIIFYQSGQTPLVRLVQYKYGP